MKIAPACGAALAAALLASPSACSADEFSATLRPEGPSVALVAALAEISGLAPAGPGRVYAHTDEEATIYELSVATGEIARKVALGRPAAVGDFEAILVRGDRLSLATSAGVVYEADLAQSGRALAFRAYDTGLGEVCEIEGFAPSGDEGYYLACKRKERRLVVHEWTRDDGASVVVDMKLAGAVPNPKDFRAADLVADPKTGTLLVLDSAAGAILEVSLKGEPRGYWRLGGDHPQAEGLAVLEDGRLLVADEGRVGRGKIGAGKLTLYPARR